MLIAYNLLLTLLLPLLLVYLFGFKSSKSIDKSKWYEYLGFSGRPGPKTRPIWIHAASVGEAVVAKSLIKDTQKLYPNEHFLVTTTTKTGKMQLSELSDTVEHRYFPIDFYLCVLLFIKTISPKKLIIIETELWPNLLTIAKQHHIPVYVVNARLSEKSFLRYKKYSAIFNIIDRSVSSYICQYQSDTNHFARLGVAPVKLHSFGSIKFDIKPSQDLLKKAAEFSATLSHRPVWIAASTHKGEDQYILEEHQKILKQSPNVLLIIVPRHPQYFDETFEVAKKFGFSVVRRTDHATVPDDCQVYVGNTLGELMMLSAAAQVCFMGGSLLGDKVGGHNVLEPISLGVPTLIGESFFNFEDIVSLFLRKKALMVLKKEAIAPTIVELLESSQLRTALSDNARSVMLEHQGAMQKTINLVMQDEINQKH